MKVEKTMKYGKGLHRMRKIKAEMFEVEEMVHNLHPQAF